LCVLVEGILPIPGLVIHEVIHYDTAGACIGHICNPTPLIYHDIVEEGTVVRGDFVRKDILPHNTIVYQIINNKTWCTW